jgi:nucleoside-diphosphate-sugar epimerase
MTKLRILVTGYLGLIGSAIYKSLRLQHDVTGIDKCGEVSTVVPFDLIIHCGANTIIREQIDNPLLAYENIETTFNIFEYARLHKARLIVFSSGRVAETKIFNNPYTVSKQFVENLAKAYRLCYNLKVTVVRPECVWGPGDNPSRAIPTWVRRAKKNLPLIIYGDKSKTLNPIYISDFISEFFTEAINDNDSEPITITGRPVLAYEMCKLIIEATGSSSKIEFKPAELAQPQQANKKTTILAKKYFQKKIIEYVRCSDESTNSD